MSFIATDEQWEKMKKHIKTDRYKREDFFVFETLAVGDRVVPNRFTKLTPELLEVMKNDAKKGVSLMLNHNEGQMGVQSIPIGKVFDARIGEGTQEGETQVLYTTQYILRDDSKVDGYSKNDIINLIESGIISDTSVGFSVGYENYKCSICGHSIYDYRKCEHVPGRKYIVNEETNEVKQCIALLYPPVEGHQGNKVLIENSVVYDGAYPNAVIQSRFGKEINLDNEEIKTVEEKEKLSKNGIIIGYSNPDYGFNLFYKSILEKGGLENMAINPEKTQNTELENEEQEVTTDLSSQEPSTEVENNNETDVINEPENVEANQSVDEPVTKESAENVYSSKDILNMFDNICNSVEDLVQLAKEGLENRNEVISEALNSGVRSMGNSFNKEVFKETFSNMQTKDIKQMGKVWEEQVSSNFTKEKISKQEFSNHETEIKVDMKQFKTSNY